MADKAPEVGAKLVELMGLEPTTPCLQSNADRADDED
jgi:hypothetical protein